MRAWVAQNPFAPVEVLVRLAADPDAYVRRAVAQNHRTSPGAPVTPELWTALLTLPRACSDGVERARVLGPDAWLASADPLVTGDRAWVAEHHSTPAEVLIRLAYDHSAYVRRCVAQNRAAPVDVLVRLASDPGAYVRARVAENPAAPAEVIVRLAADPDAYVRRAVAERCSAPVDALARLASDPDVYVRIGVAQNPATPSEALSRLAADLDARVRRWVARHPSRLRCSTGSPMKTPTTCGTRSSATNTNAALGTGAPHDP